MKHLLISWTGIQGADARPVIEEAVKKMQEQMNGKTPVSHSIAVSQDPVFGGWLVTISVFYTDPSDKS